MNQHGRTDEHTTDGERSHEVRKMIVEHLKWQNEIEYGLGDTYDVKTSIALVVIVFLATQSTTFLSAQIPLHWRVIQMISAVCLVTAGALSVVALFPRTYKVGMSPEAFIGWIERVKLSFGTVYTPEREAETLEFVRTKQIDQMKTRFICNSKINLTKSRLVEWVFRFTAAALILNLFTLLRMMTGWRF